MTREEAIKILKHEQEYCDFDSQGYEAYSLAIKALEHNTSILENIKAEIKEADHWDKAPNDVDLGSYSEGLTKALTIIDNHLNNYYPNCGAKT